MNRSEHIDVLIVGAGLSGIGAAHHLQERCPDRTYLILEAREAIGGTWDLFRYPGIRSDSDMYTLGYSFEPWPGDKAIADGASILRYIRNVAEKNGIDRRIRFDHRVVRASWSSADARWTVEAERGDSGERVSLTCNWLHLCSGYYDYEQGYLPDFAGLERFSGTFLHPQFWPEDLDYRGKRVVVIGSGATAVTLVPELAREAAHVTMLQRSPSYMVSLPSRDRIAGRLRRWFGARASYPLIRWKNVLLQMVFYQLARRRPDQVKRKMIGDVRKLLGADFDVQRHFTPRYNPWDQRVCLVPDEDLFTAIRNGSVSVVTGAIDSITETGLRLKSGEKIDADIIVSATGLQIRVMGGVELLADGEPQDLGKTLTYKGMMFSDLPNLTYSFGYTNASWTLKSDLTSAYLCRMLNQMSATGCQVAVARRTSRVEERPFVDFTSGYVERAIHLLPKQGDRAPWRLHQNYALDMAALKFGRLDDGVLQFGRCG